MEISQALKELRDYLTDHFERNICDVTKDHADKFRHMLPDWLSGEETKKEAMDLVQEILKDAATGLAKQYLKIDLKKYLD